MDYVPVLQHTIAIDFLSIFKSTICRAINNFHDMATFYHLAVDSRHFWVDHLEVISCVPANLELRICYCYIKW
jgi:hypothetical protein